MESNEKERDPVINFNIGNLELSDQARVTNIGNLTAEKVLFNSEPREKPRTKPTSTVPFDRDPKFIDREDVFEKLKVLFEPSDIGHRVALWGLGGVGKSQIAIEYAHRTRLSSPETWVFWVYCSNAVEFEKSMRKIAKKLRLSEAKSSTQDLLEAVNQWLDDEENGKWLLILDSADDAQILTEEPVGSKSEALYSYIPFTKHGDILITSRDRSSAFTLIGDDDRLLHLENMTETQAMALLRSRTNVTSADEADARRLLQFLEYLPLAITQAGAYLNHMQPLTIAEYSTELQSSYENMQTNRLSKQFADLRRDRSVPNSILLTWQQTLTQLQRSYTEAFDLLCLIATFHRNGIPHQLLVEEGNLVYFRENSSTLRNFALILIQSSWEVSMHRLIQLVVRASMREAGMSERFGVKATTQLVETLGLFENRSENYIPRLLKLFPHLEELAYREFKAQNGEIQRCRILVHLLEWYVAFPHDKKAMAIAERMLGVTDNLSHTRDINLLFYRLRVARLYLQLEDFDRARSLLNSFPPQAHFGRTWKEGIFILRVQDALVKCDMGQGLLDEAEKRAKIVYESYKTMVPENKRYTILGANTLAEVYQRQGRTQEAKDFLKAEVARYEKLANPNLYAAMVGVNREEGIHYELILL